MCVCVIVFEHHYVADIIECQSNPCENSAACADAVNMYTCECVAGYTGIKCETGMCDTITDVTN